MIKLPEYKSTDEALRLVTADGKEFILPYAWSVDGENSLEMRSKTEERALSHGGVDVGDYKAKPKTLDIDFYIKAKSRAEFDRAFDEIKGYFVKQNYKLYVGRANQYYRVSRLAKIKDKFLPGYKGRYSDASITVRCTDPFRYSDDRIEKVIKVESQAGAEGFEIKIDNLGNVDAPLVVSFTPESVMSSIEMTSEQTKDFFTVQDTMLVSGNTLTVDGERSTVYRGSSNAISTFSGVFLSLAAGENVLKYKGAPGEITLKYTPRWW